MKKKFYLFLIYFISIYIFQKGFFLTRKELLNKNNCIIYSKNFKTFSNYNNSNYNDNYNDNNNNNNNNEIYKNCKKEEFKKVIIFIIDGLRYDFKKYFNSINKLSNDSYLLYKFIAGFLYFIIKL
jgi:hypothetical protein